MEKMNKKTQNQFVGKKITVMGLGLLGKGLGDTRFLAERGAIVTVTDLKTKAELASSVAALSKYPNIRFVLGKHDFKDFENCDFVLKAQGVPLDSPYVAHARAKGIPIRMDDELFLEQAAKDITVIGVTGTRGKTTTASLIFHVLKSAGKRAHLAGNIRGVATLELLPKIKSGDFVVLELSSWQLQGFHERKISPHIAVFTNFMDDHLNYYPSRKEYFFDKTAICAYQKKDDVLILTEGLTKKIKKVSSKIVVANAADIPKIWQSLMPGEHNRTNSACAVAVAQALGISKAEIKKGIESFHGVHGRLEYMKTLSGNIRVYNDNSASTPEATVTALRALVGETKKIVLVLGGSDKGLPLEILVKEIEKTCAHIVLMPGTGSEAFLAIRQKILGKNTKIVPITPAKNLPDAVAIARSLVRKNDVFLFSPGFASFGAFVNYYERGDQFEQIVKKLK